MALICVTLAVDDPQRLRAEHAALVSQGCRLVEYRLDFLPPSLDIERLLAGRPGPLIATVRRPDDGGRWRGPEDDRRNLLRRAIAAGVEYVDLEPDAARALPRTGSTKRIVSMHNFTETPADLSAIHERLAACDADVVKLATTARSPVDNFRMLRLVRDARVPTVGLCMGELGAASRVLNARFGSPFSYAAPSEAAAVAPGQLSFAAMRDLYRYEAIVPDGLLLCVVGDPIGHSRSPHIHNAALAAAGMAGTYVAFRVPPGYVDDFVREARQIGFRGISVTIPHKEAVLRAAGRMHPAALAIGAANTFVFESDGTTTAYNTDEPGALESLEAAAGGAEGTASPLAGRTALVLGAGGAAKAIVYGLLQRGANVVVCNRNRSRADDLAASLKCDVVDWESRTEVAYDVLVNCTPLGMHPNIGDTPLEARYLRSGAIVFDTVYNPRDTRLLREARERGCTPVPGTEMFLRQAAWQFRYFTGCEPPLETMRAALDHSA